MTVAGMNTWDLMRLIDYLEERGEWNTEHLAAWAFPGGGLQTLYLAALDERVRYAVISGYLYGFKDSLLELNGNCSCNYVPGLWNALDMGDIASLIAPRPLVIQSGRADHLNGPRALSMQRNRWRSYEKPMGLTAPQNVWFTAVMKGAISSMKRTWKKI